MCHSEEMSGHVPGSSLDSPCSSCHCRSEVPPEGLHEQHRGMCKRMCIQQDDLSAATHPARMMMMMF